LTPNAPNATFRVVADAVGPGEAARRLGVSTRTVQRWLRDGRLPAVRVGSRTKVDASALPPASGESPPRRIERLLVANRGELVVRIARTCRQLGIRTLALVAEDQARAWWTAAADKIVPLAGSYLDVDAVLAAAAAARADALHPGYGFLAENADFAQAVSDADITWVGPPAAAMRTLGDKAAARRLAARLGVQVLDGYDGDDQSDTRLLREARRIGFPLLVKPSAGGGGKGMHVVEASGGLRDTLARARREAAAAFGDDRLILERYLPRPRHVEVQLLCDEYGGAVYLGERECSLQRRHQKVVEEAPSPAVNARLRRRLGDAALALAREAGYVGAGTAEFLLDEDGSFYFLEVNARLQVEHPVTEMVTGRDLVADQLAIASGQRLDLDQRRVSLSGFSIEARLYAEDAQRDFLPATGEILAVSWPRGDGVRVDAGVGAGDVVGTRYDPLLAKLIVHAETRAAAVSRLVDALDATSVLGVTTNRGFLQWLLKLPSVMSGRTHTTLIADSWRPPDGLSDDDWRAAALALASHLAEQGRPAGFRLNAPPRLRLQIGAETRSISLDSQVVSPRWAALAADAVMLDIGGQALEARLSPPPTVDSTLRRAGHADVPAEIVGAPMPGSVIAVHVAEGDEVEVGRVLVVLEAMKMENNVPAPAAGRVGRVLVQVGQQVQRGETLVELA
jgi:excisionase family DNA binding protein